MTQAKAQVEVAMARTGHGMASAPQATVAPRLQRRSRWHRLALAFCAALVALTGGALYGAYGYQPAEPEPDYRSPFLAAYPSRFVETPVARFHYVQAGAGSPVVLVSPGAAWAFAWQRQLPSLAANHTVYVVDLPGQGYTQLKDPDFGWDLLAMTSALESFLDGVGLERTALAGNSWSGGWALAFAQRHPERVDKLLLLAPSGLAVRDPWSWEILKLPVVGELLTNLFATRSTIRDSAERVVVHRELITDELVDEWWAPATFRNNLRSTYLLERGLDWTETEGAMPTTRTPTLVLWGSEDAILPVRQAERFGALLPVAEVHVLDGCGHALMLDCADVVNALMTNFLNGR